MPENSRFVFTGGPGAGKSVVLDALNARGFYCVPEVARALITARLNSGLSPRPAPAEFARSILDADIANYQAVSALHEVSFFDRGVVDALCMLNQSGAISEDELQAALRQYSYNQTVFLFPPWKDIYEADAERDQTFEEAVGVFATLKSWYTRCGYRFAEVPISSVGERVAFIERSIAAAATGRKHSE